MARSVDFLLCVRKRFTATFEKIVLAQLIFGAQFHKAFANASEVFQPKEAIC